MKRPVSTDEYRAMFPDCDQDAELQRACDGMKAYLKSLELDNAYLVVGRG